jgi:hypothetical protein
MMAYEPAKDDALSDEQRTRIEEIISRELEDAKQYIDTEIGEQRAESTEYYNGEPFGDEEEGRSQVISRDVRDTVMSLMPSAMRMFFGGEKVVEFKPRGPEDIAAAEQATAYINEVVVQQDNAGFLEFHSAIKDAFVRKLGIFKWWWDDQTVVTTTEHSGLSEEDLGVFAEDPSVEKIEGELTSDEGILPKVFKAKVTRKRPAGIARFAAVPTDEFLVDRRAKLDPDTWVFAAHRQMLTVAELVAMGYDRETVLEHAGSASELDDTRERLARNPFSTLFGSDNTANPDMRRVLYTESYTRLRLKDEENEPVQLTKVCGIGDGAGYYLLHAAPCDEMPFAVLCPDPEPHTLFGLCPADVVKDLQRIKSAILRGTLDSLALSIHPRYEAVDDMVNLQDLMNSEIGGVVRVKQPGMLREIALPFVGANTLPMLEYVDKIREDRTKQSQASQGLDADALQSSTKAAVSATISAAQAQIELYCRIFAETGVKRLFRGLYKLTVQHQDKPRTVRLRGELVEMDPRSWDAEMDVAVNVALGAGSIEEKMALLMGVAAKQEQVLLAAPGNPMVSMRELRATYARMVELGGYKDAGVFFKEVPEGYQPPAPPDGGEKEAAAALAQVQMAEIRARAQTEAAKLAFEKEKAAAEDARERYRIETEMRTKLLIASQTDQTKITVAEIDAMIEKMKMQQEAAVRTAEARIQAQAQVDSVKAQPKESKE